MPKTLKSKYQRGKLNYYQPTFLPVYNHFVPVAKGSVQLVNPLISSTAKIQAN